MITQNIVNEPAFKAAAITPLWRTLAADTSLVAFNIRVTPGDVVPKKGLPLRLYYATTSFTIDPAVAPQQLSRQAKSVEILLPWKAGVPVFQQAEAHLAVGQQLYVWTDAPNLDASVALEIDVVEI